MAQVDWKKVLVLVSKRWILAYISMCGSCVIYMLRVNMSVAIVCMVMDDVNSTSLTNHSNGNNSANHNNGSNSTIQSNESSSTNYSNISDVKYDADRPIASSHGGEFNWDKATQAMMLSAFSYGYVVLQIPGGWLAGRWSAKHSLGMGVLVSAMTTVLIPKAARWDFRAVYALRAIMGLAQALCYPAMNTLICRWSPAMERTRMLTFIYSGNNAGIVIAFFVSGLLCAYGFDNGWGSIFYVTGGAAFVWVFVWFVFVSDSPEDHPSISQTERDYIVSHRGDTQTKKFQVPWRSVIKSRGLWVCAIAHVCNNWKYATLLTGLPTFMKEVLKYDIEQNGVLSSVPYLATICTQIFAGHAADFLRQRYLSTTHTRRLFQTVSFLGSAACIVAVGFTDCERRAIAVVLLCVAIALEGLCYAGFMVNHMDFAPRYAGVLYAITNFFGAIASLLAPTVIGVLTTNKTQLEWRNVFYVCGVFMVIGTIVFGGFAAGEVETWAVEAHEDDPKSETPDISDGKLSKNIY